MRRTFSFLFVLAALPSLAAVRSLTVDQVWGRSPLIVYELPEADGRAEAIHYVEEIRDRFKRGGEVLDAAANPGILKSKLAHGFVLYTTLGEKSNLLRLATGKLGWDMSGGVFRWREMSAPTGETGLILVAQNPYSQGYCVIFAAGSNRTLVGINGLPHGRSSYHIYRGSLLLREGTYDGSFVSHERIAKAAALQDATQFFKTLERVHPDLLRRVTRDAYQKLKEQTVDGIAGKTDSKGEIAVEDVASLLFYAGAFFRDGHTFVGWYPPVSEWNSRGKRFPAFRLRYDNGRFVVAAAKDPSLVDQEVVDVNGTPAEEFLRPILDRCSGELAGFRISVFLAHETFWYNLTNLFGDGAPYTLRLRDLQGGERQAVLETLPFADYEAFRAEGGGEPFRPNARGTAVEFFDSGATAHFLYSVFHSSPAEKKKIESIFEEVKAKGSQNLIVDVRGNPGGQSDMGELIFSHLYSAKFRSFRKVSAKASLDITHDVTWAAWPLLFVLQGRVIGVKIGEKQPRRPVSFFPGRVYLLTDNGSFSMATDFAAMVRDYGAGTILGYETGGVPHMFGGPHGFLLKNSRIFCAVSWTENLPPKPWPGDADHGVMPTVPLNDRKLAEFRGEQDPVLAFTLHYIHSSGAAPASR